MNAPCGVDGDASAGVVPGAPLFAGERSLGRGGDTHEKLPDRGLRLAANGPVEKAYRMAGPPDGVVMVSFRVRWMDRFAWSSTCSFLLFSSAGGSATPRFFSAFRVAIPLSRLPELL